MNFEDLVETREIQHGEKKYRVRGLSFADITQVLYDDRETLFRFVDAVKGGKEDEIVENGLSALSQFPSLAAKFLACALDVPDQWASVAKMPAGLQMKMLVAIGELTFVDAAGAVETVGNVLRVVRSGTKALSDLKSAQTSGTGTLS